MQTEANYRMAFAMVSDDNDEPKKTGKKKEILCFCLPKHPRMDPIC